MPNKSKSRNTSRKSTASSQGAPVVRLEEDEFASIIVKTKQPSSRKSTPNSNSKTTTPSADEKRPDFLEPLPSSPKPTPASTPWDVLGMSETDYYAMMDRVKKMYLEMDKKAYQYALEEELNSPSYWRMRMEHLEKEREYFNKKRGWSAMDIACVDNIDAQIYECEQELEQMYAEADRLEVEYD
jgi:hypothetical protein